MATEVKSYVLDGTLLEACSCGGPCPCWVGDDPDGGSCDAFNAYHVERGVIDGVDVSGLSVVSLHQIPGNVLAGNWRQILYVDDRATPEQRDTLLAAFTGKLGGPLGDLAALIGERVAVYSVPIQHHIRNGQGTLLVGDKISAEIEPYRDAAGRTTKLVDTLFSTIPGSPAVVAKAPRHMVSVPEHQMSWELSNRNAIQGDFHLEA
jgi:hypothetical protein